MMKIPAIVASLTLVGSIAYAAGHGTAGAHPPLSPGALESRPIQHEMQPQGLQMTGGCTQGADKNWFTTVHVLPEGCQIARELVSEYFGSKIDANGDGLNEYLIGTSRNLISSGTAQDVCIVTLSELSTANGEVSQISSCVARNAELAAEIKRIYPQVNTAYPSGGVGARDMDGDGDLDIVIEVFGQTSSGEFTRTFWLENTGFPHTARITGDLNSDGKVNGADLGILLGNWRN